MSETSLTTEVNQVLEHWLKPPHIVHYSNSRLITNEKNCLVCEFNFPKKYSENIFYIDNEKILEKHEMFKGKRFFYDDRFYSLLEFYGDDNRLNALYFDISLPAYIKNNSVLIADIKLDIFYIINTQKLFILDQDEFDEAKENQTFNKEELLIAEETLNFITSSIISNKFEDIFLNYKKSSASDWDRYLRHLSLIE